MTKALPLRIAVCAICGHFFRVLRSDSKACYPDCGRLYKLKHQREYNKKANKVRVYSAEQMAAKLARQKARRRENRERYKAELQRLRVEAGRTKEGR